MKLRLRFSFWSIFLLFLASMCFHGSGARKMAGEELKAVADHHPKIPMDDNNENVLELHSMDGEERKHDGHVHGHGPHGHGHEISSSQSHFDPSSIILFTVTDLKPGKTLPIYFPEKDPSSYLPSLPKEKADSIPFSYSQLQPLLEFFSFPQGSPQAKAVEFTLKGCELKPRKGETKFCATSHESMHHLLHNIFGVDSDFRALSTSYLKRSNTLLQNYTILGEAKEIAAPKMVACHTMPYPYAIFYCHSHGRDNKVFEVSLQGENGDRVEAVSVCHMDTSDWEVDNVSFRILGIRHGAPVCHFFPAGDLIWVPKPAATLDC